MKQGQTESLQTIQKVQFHELPHESVGMKILHRELIFKELKKKPPKIMG